MEDGATFTTLRVESLGVVAVIVEISVSTMRSVGRRIVGVERNIEDREKGERRMRMR